MSSKQVSPVLALVAGLALMSRANADTFVLPHILEKAGVIVGITWNPTGGQAGIAIDEGGTPKVHHKPTRIPFSPMDNDELITWVGANLEGVNYTPSYTIYSADKATDKGIVYASTAEQVTLTQAVFPGGDVNSNEQRMVLASGQPTIIDNKKGLLVDFKLISKLVKKQKLWTCSNFRVTIPGLPTSHVVTTQPIRYVRVAAGDVNGDGFADFAYQQSNFTFTIPQADAAPYFKYRDALAQGVSSHLQVQMEYLDDQGNQAIGVLFEGEVVGVDSQRIFDDPTDPSNLAQVTIAKLTSKPVSITNQKLDSILGLIR